MNRKRIVGIAAAVVTLAGTTLIASARPTAAPPPGSDAPKALVGTYTTKLTQDEIRSAPAGYILPSDPRWKLVILNAAGGSARALGMVPTNHGGATIPFSVTGKRIFLQCMSEGVGTLPGHPTRGHSTYSWSISGRMLRFKLVSQPCKSSDDKAQPIVLASEPWHKVR